MRRSGGGASHALLLLLLLLAVIAGLFLQIAAFRALPAQPTVSSIHKACYGRRPLATALFSSSSSSSTMSEIKVVNNPDEATLASMGVKSWPTWGCEASTFPWTYGESETCYILQGKVTVTPNGGAPVTVGKGDLVTFPEGMGCTWEVHEAIRKHYKFH